MSQRRTQVEGIGEVILAKRRGSSNMRLSVNSIGQVRVSMPYWAPYEAGVLFLKSKKNWIRQRLSDQVPILLNDGIHIGKSHKLIIINDTASNGVADVRIGSTLIEAKTTLPINSLPVQSCLIAACERALKKESLQLLPKRTDGLSKSFELPYNSLKIRKLTSRWGSCSTKKNISLSYFLIQLPWELIDYVILHELAHTKYLDHSPRYWDFMQTMLPGVKEFRRQLKKHKPRIEPI